ncbi:MAG: hypothetical protein HC923_07175, partial [Myxococcales bacterium]|nr:hypothetical protein [Myxococcales bacterium]
MSRWALLVAMVSFACQEDPGLVPAPGQPLEPPDRLDFGPVLVGATRILPLTVLNQNRTAVVIEQVRIAEGDEWFSVVEGLSSVERRGEGILRLAFTPTAPEEEKVG